VATGAAILLVIWAIAVVVMSTLGVTGKVKTTTVNGMRRRRPGESDAAWRAGLRALYPFTIASALALVGLAIALMLTPSSWFYAVLLGGLAVVLAIVLVGIAAMNSVIRRMSEARA